MVQTAEALITAVRLLQKQPGVDESRIYLHGASEGTLLVASAATRIPSEVAGLVIYGVVADTLKEALRFMSSEGIFLQHLGHWDTNEDPCRARFQNGRVSTSTTSRSETSWSR